MAPGGRRRRRGERREEPVEELVSGAVVRRVGVVPARNKPEAGKLAETLLAWLRDRGIEALDESALQVLRRQGEITDHVDAIVTLGGDGLMLVAAREWPGVPLLGINFGHLGFLTAVEHNDWQSGL